MIFTQSAAVNGSSISHTIIVPWQGDAEEQVAKRQHIASSGHTDWALYDLERDIGELYNVAKEYPDIVKRLKKLGNKSIEEIKRNRREPGRIGKKNLMI